MVRGEYILGTNYIDFFNVGIRKPRVSTEHRMILDEPKGGGVRSNRRYYHRW